MIIFLIKVHDFIYEYILLLPEPMMFTTNSISNTASCVYYYLFIHMFKPNYTYSKKKKHFMSMCLTLKWWVYVLPTLPYGQGRGGVVMAK